MHKWLSIVGIGEDGLAGLNPIARSLLAQAHILVGGARHLAMLPPDDPREKLPWTAPIATSIEAIIRRRGAAYLRARQRRSDVLRHRGHAYSSGVACGNDHRSSPFGLQPGLRPFGLARDGSGDGQSVRS